MIHKSFVLCEKIRFASFLSKSVGPSSLMNMSSWSFSISKDTKRSDAPAICSVVSYARLFVKKYHSMRLNLWNRSHVFASWNGTGPCCWKLLGRWWPISAFSQLHGQKTRRRGR